MMEKSGILYFEEPKNGNDITHENPVTPHSISKNNGSGGGGGDMNDRLLSLEHKANRLDERLRNIGRVFREFSTEVRGEFKSTQRHTTVVAVACLAIGIAILIGFAQVQSSLTQKIIDANHETTKTQIAAGTEATRIQIESFNGAVNKFERESDRNYGLALKALERSMDKQVQDSQ